MGNGALPQGPNLDHRGHLDGDGVPSKCRAVRTYPVPLHGTLLSRHDRPGTRPGFVLAENVADRPGDVGRRERRGRDLVEQRLEAMMVLPVGHGDLARSAAYGFRLFDAAETRADGDNLRPSIPLCLGIGDSMYTAKW